MQTDLWRNKSMLRLCRVAVCTSQLPGIVDILTSYAINCGGGTNGRGSAVVVFESRYVGSSGVLVVANDLAAVVNPVAVGEKGVRIVERSESSVLVAKTVFISIGVVVVTDHGSRIIDLQYVSKNGSRKVDGGISAGTQE